MGAPPDRAAVILGAGSWLPSGVVTNHDLGQRLDTSDQWIRDRTGIAERRHVRPGVSTSDLATAAGELAIKAAGGSGVDVVLLATTTPDRLCPATAPEVASRLGMTGVGAFDLAAVCAGFVYGMATAAGLIASGCADRVLLIGAETYSTIIDPDDRTTAAIFGDGAGALVLGAGAPDAPGAVGRCVLGSDGEHADLIMIPAGGSRQRSAGTRPSAKDHYFTMAGREVYRHAVERMLEVSTAALRCAGWSPREVDRFAAHQANARINRSVADRLGIAEDRRLSNIALVGNTAAASIPLLLTQSAAGGSLHPGDRMLVTAFGGGLAWGATTLVWPDIDVCSAEETFPHHVGEEPCTRS